MRNVDSCVGGLLIRHSTSDWRQLTPTNKSGNLLRCWCWQSCYVEFPEFTIWNKKGILLHCTTICSCFFCITFQYHCSVFCGRKAKTKCASIHARQQRHGIFCWTTYARPVFTGIIPRPAVSNTHSNILNRSLLPNGKSRLRPMHRSTIYVGVGCCVVASGFSTYVDCPKLYIYIYWHIVHSTRKHVHIYATHFLKLILLRRNWAIYILVCWRHHHVTLRHSPEPRLWRGRHRQLASDIFLRR